MKEWICQEEPLIRTDGASVGVGFRQMVELVRCKDCKYAAPDMACSHESEWGNEISRNRGNPDWYCADGEREDK